MAEFRFRPPKTSKEEGKVSLCVAVPFREEKRGEGTSTKSWHESCYVMSCFCMEIYNDSLLDKDVL